MIKDTARPAEAASAQLTLMISSLDQCSSLVHGPTLASTGCRSRRIHQRAPVSTRVGAALLCPQHGRAPTSVEEKPKTSPAVP